MLQEPFRKEWERLQKWQIIVPWGIDKMMPKANGIVLLCVVPARLNQAIIRHVHRDLTVNDILSRLTCLQYLTLINTHWGYDNLKLDQKFIILTSFTCQFGRYRYARLPFDAAAARDMFQHKMDKIFKDLPNIFGIANDILIAVNNENGHDHDTMLRWVMQTNRKEIFN